MKKYLLLAVISLSLGACQKADEEVIPNAITSAFDQDFTLNYRQQALLPSSSQPELTIRLADLQYNFCPKDVICCFMPNSVAPIFNVTDEQGQTQEVKLPIYSLNRNYPNWIDTISVRANGRRYILYHTKYNVKEGNDQPEKKDISVDLRITKPVVN